MNIPNYLTLFLLTLPFLLIYMIFATIYFKIIDKKNIDKVGMKKHGLSRMCLGGIFFMFGLIIYNLIGEFLTIFLNKIFEEETLNYNTNIAIIDFFIKSISYGIKDFHTDILINFTVVCTALYTGTEGIISSLRTLQLEPGMSIELPSIKRKRMSIIFYIWSYIALISTVYTTIIGSKEISFYTSNIYVSLGATLIILFLAERSSSVFKTAQVKIPVKTTTQANIINAVKPIISEEKETNKDKESVIADHITDTANISL